MKTWPERVIQRPWSIVLVCYLLVFISSSSQAQGQHEVFLPLIFSPPPALLPNGDFETVPIQWNLVPDGEQLIFSQTELPEGIIAFSGSHVGWLGDHQHSDHSHYNEISQTVVVPVSTPILRFWRFFVSSESDCSTSKDQFIVCLGQPGALDCQPLLTEPLCHEVSTFTWFQEIVPLNAFAGQSITLRIQVKTNNLIPLSNTSEVFLDDFTFSNH